VFYELFQLFSSELNGSSENIYQCDNVNVTTTKEHTMLGSAQISTETCWVIAINCIAADGVILSDDGPYIYSSWDSVEADLIEDEDDDLYPVQVTRNGDNDWVDDQGVNWSEVARVQAGE
jgi:hypothetical protein